MKARRGLKDYAALAVAVAVFIVIEIVFGEIAITRLFGLIFAVGYVWTLLCTDRPAFGLLGWQRAIFLVPLALVGVAMAVWAPELTCVSPKHRHLCQ